MNASQKVHYNKLMGYMSPFDTTRILTPQYRDLKQQTQELSERLSMSKSSQRLLNQQLGPPIKLIRLGNASTTRNQGSNTHSRSSSVLHSNQSLRYPTRALQSQEAVAYNSNNGSQFLTKSLMVNSEASAIENRSQSIKDSRRLITIQLPAVLPKERETTIMIVEETLPAVWSELKFSGKLCEGRSFATSIEYEGNLYFYGGYDAVKGVFSDFTQLKLSDTQPSSFSPVQVADTNTFYPGRLCRYGAIRRQNKMVVFGGKPSSLSSTNRMFEYCFETHVFTQIECTLESGEQMPTLDSHSLHYHEQTDSLILFGGFLGEHCTYSNAVYVFSFATNKWTIKNQPKQQQNELKEGLPEVPAPRGSHGAVITNDTLYIYGGTSGEIVYDDLWSYSLAENKWTLIDTSKQQYHPGPRSGISMIVHGQFLVVFGGFKSLINEKNDLSVLNLSTKEWVYQSMRRESTEVASPLGAGRYKNSSGGLKMSPEKQIGSNSIIGNTVGSMLSPEGTRKRYMSPKKPNSHAAFLCKPIRQLSPHDEDASDVNRSRRIDGKAKVNHEKKMQLLKMFHTTEEKRKQLLSPVPIHQSMNSSLNMLAHCNLSHKYDAANQLHLKTNHLTSTEAKITGKHPGARDGYLCSLVKGKAIFFGGDRHRMSLNDAYELDLALLVSSISKSK